MTSSDLATLTITDLAHMIKERKISPVDVTEAVLNKIEANDSKINAYITVLKEEALSRAKEAEQEISTGHYRGPLHGIPLAVKDNIDMKGVRTTHGSKIHGENVASRDATVVTRLLEAGMIPVGKTNMHEYAYGVTTNNPHFNPTRNPWDTSRIPGGSSGGSGAALAAHMAIAALGTDTAGSVRIPSACCGTVGLKPTFGAVSKQGVFPLSWTLDHVGPMTKTVQDAGLMLEAMAGYDEKDPSSVNQSFTNYNKDSDDLRGIVVGIPEVAYQQIDSSVLEGLEKMTEQLKRLGAEVRPVTIKTLSHVSFAGYATLCVEASAIHHHQMVKNPEDFGADVATLLKFGEVLTGVQYMQAQQLRRLISEELNEVYKSIDAILLPTLPVPAPKINQQSVQIGGEEFDVTDALIRLTSIANVSGLPALALPSGLSENGLPVSIQLVGKAFDEQKLLTIGHQLEQTQPLLGKQPVF